ncbi:MAG: hypothetical protein A3F54_01710 [Candidatus Kerfeldbacteria bacterium RIFCSPHIGHO2_12_FULL_48_17]|uniref:Glycerophosphoryl diester phosphodiesterase membrane domain-containing protein n=1 Tax=Candidatus Kerfeldbacteria bacterium RIFCSPHIGHO2_12_FULL_48_17 TaxID=1798542 RepID=A0A1G2B137_9BACT|nr:MAG: hypothetical protein A3F54_01710 [Candidatus Kerfeldbacteria bacterium RIFCSPHIGHO2_12_FULL_48_17]
MKKQTKFSVPKTAPKLMGTSDLIKKSWEDYKAHFGSLIGLVFTPLLAGVPLAIIIGIWAVMAYGSNQVGGSGTSPVVNWSLGILSLIALIVLIVGVLWGYSAMLAKIVNMGLSYKESLRLGWKKFWTFLWVSILVGLITMGGNMLLLIPGFILSIYTMFAIYAVFEEEKKGLAAVSRSFELVKGYWWAVFGRGLLIWIILGAAMMVIGLLTLGIGTYVVTIFGAPFLLIFTRNMYRNLIHLKGTKTNDEAKKPLFIVFAILGLIAWPAYIWLLIAATPETTFEDERQIDYEYEDFDYYGVEPAE